MVSFEHEALGTRWSFLIDVDNFPSHYEGEVINLITNFEQRFSRFLPTSEIRKISESTEPTQLLSPELAKMLTFSQEVKRATQGAFDPNVADILVGLGYDPTYSFQQNNDQLQRKRGEWSITELTLSKTGSVAFDLGAFGKGALIDLLSEWLKNQGFWFYLVEGGGDMFGTSKADGSAWNIALEHPLDTESALGTLSLKNQGLAVSNSQKRRWGKTHHLVHPERKTSVSENLASYVVAPTAMTADALATAYFVTPQGIWSGLANKFSAPYLVLETSGKAHISSRFQAQLFS